MRRHHRAGGPTVHAGKVNGGPVPDPFALIRAFDSETNPTKPVRPSPLTASTIQGLPLDLIDRLRSFPLFLSAPDSFLAAIGTHLRPQLYSPHDTIIAEGDEAKAMYWLVRGAVRVTSRDGESTFAELRPGAFFGEIGILMEIPRTATIVAKMRSMVVRLNKEDLKKELPKFPEVEQSILDEAKERLAILERKKKELRDSKQHARGPSRSGKRTRDTTDGDVEMGDAGEIRDGEVVVSNKKRKSPSPGLAEAAASSAIGSGVINVRQLLKELPLFSSMPSDILHFLGLNAQPRTYPPFTDIIQQGSHGRDVFFIVRECLAIGGDVLNELWQRCSPELRQQIESTARARLEAAAQRDTEMTDVCDDIILVKIFQHLDIGELMRLRIISMHWLKIVTSSPSILYDLDLTPYNRRVTDRVLTDIICPFVGQRPRSSNSNSKFNNFPPGFQHWSVYPFPNLTRICLADCTYLTDNAIVFLTNAAKALRELDLSFCCALSDTATEVLALGCPMLTHLNLAFCGSAVSDSSLRSISLHLLELKYLSVRGCVRVTGTGVEAVLEGCSDLEEFDVSQCKNLSRWIDNGGIQRKGRGVKFATVADGTWRVPRT
ncbi:putative cyclic nucleotide-binding domain-containing protein [Neofusicoccum parvum UCRNP2]|uniref:Putative cyclic nucleotide-binding domain-containing protein n=1 Tax=Botryosphaeria parva (strain UCR-NP2) TaxID=1287680 RepID=R1GAD7_BOTPV|nr:putative cyclic nucleotide-binding domain-containing protein [Neofusicoccum parvum UCRNP2]